MKRGPLKLFYSYAHEDAGIRDRIDQLWFPKTHITHNHAANRS